MASIHHFDPWMNHPFDKGSKNSPDPSQRMFLRTPTAIPTRPIGSWAELDIGSKGEKSRSHHSRRRGESMLVQNYIPLPSEVATNDTDRRIRSLESALETVYTYYEVRL